LEELYYQAKKNCWAKI